MTATGGEKKSVAILPFTNLSQDPANAFYAVSAYLSTTTVLYKRGGFTPDEITRLHATTKGLSFDEFYKTVNDPKRAKREIAEDCVKTN